MTLEKAMLAESSFVGDYAYGGDFPLAPNPCIVIDGLGLVGLPLSSRDASAIMTTVATTEAGAQHRWEVPADRITFSNPRWQAFLDATVRSVCAKLGARVDEGSLAYELQKLLLYEPGSQ